MTDIPVDYDGVMGVPITFLDKYCPEQFEILQLCAPHGKYIKNICNEAGCINGKWIYARILICKRDFFSIDFSDWYDEFIKQSPYIRLVTSQIETVTKQIKNGFVSDFIWDVECDNVTKLLRKWTGNTYVGCEKPGNFKDAFHQFFVALYNQLLAMRVSNIGDMACFANSALFQGTVYRYLGHSSYNDEKIIPVFDNIYVSWSTNNKSLYFESKLHGTMTFMECDICDDCFGIDLRAFEVSPNNENEIVFPTIEKYVTNIQYISENKDK